MTTQDNETTRIRGRKGQELRRKRLERQSLCIMCLEDGHIVEAVEVDHITPLAKGGTDTDDNTRNLCRQHHKLVTAEQFNFRKKRTFGLDGFPLDD
ncbi:HNH endonuclease signature motif containing protein [Aureimonas altamirensis]|uniref:HNH endonuclease signature motif containing protein n=1 Tax=Aureimonas altamirensis TaxID=370622 RepID=UPI003AFA6E40